MLQECAAAERKVAIYGRGEAAELSYMSLKESGLEPVAIFDADGGHVFLGMPVQSIEVHGEVDYDLLIIASLEKSIAKHLELVLRHGVPRGKVFPLRREPRPVPRRRAAAEKTRSNNGKHR